MIAPTAAMEVLLELHVMNGTRLRQGCRLRCTQQWRPKSTSFGHTKKKSWDLKHNSSYRWDLTVCFWDMNTTSHAQPSSWDKCKWQNGFNPETEGAWSKTNKGTGAGVYRWGLRRGHCFSLGLHTTVFQAGIYATKSCLTGNKEKSWTGRNSYILFIHRYPLIVSRWIPNKPGSQNKRDMMEII
jgi:hypothetical protein